MTGHGPTDPTANHTHAAPDDAGTGRPPEASEGLEELDVEVVEDLDVDDDGTDVRGGTSLGCRLD